MKTGLTGPCLTRASARVPEASHGTPRIQPQSLPPATSSLLRGTEARSILEGGCPDCPETVSRFHVCENRGCRSGAGRRPSTAFCVIALGSLRKPAAGVPHGPTGLCPKAKPPRILKRSPRPAGLASAPRVHPECPRPVRRVGLHHVPPRATGRMERGGLCVGQLRVRDEAPQTDGSDSRHFSSVLEAHVPDPGAAGLVPPEASPGRADGRVVPVSLTRDIL